MRRRFSPLTLLLLLVLVTGCAGVGRSVSADATDFSLADSYRQVIGLLTKPGA